MPSIPVSPIILKEWSWGATILQVNLATTPEANLMQATEKSGAFTSNGISVCLSGIRQDEKAVTDCAGPKNAVSHVT